MADDTVYDVTTMTLDKNESKIAILSEIDLLSGFKLEEGIVSISFFVLAIAWIFSDPGFIPGWIEWFPEPGFIKDGVPAMLIGIILFIIPGLYAEETNSYKVSSFHKRLLTILPSLY